MSRTVFGRAMAHIPGDGGKRKSSYVQVGIALKDDATGDLSIKIDAIPRSPHWEGWINIWTEESGKRVKSTYVDPGLDEVPF